MRLLVRAPSKSIECNLELAEIQWNNYCLTLEQWFDEIIFLPGDDNLHGSVFIEDTVVIFNDIAVITSPGSICRYEEINEVKKTILELDIPMYTINLPGTLDGGDVLKVGKTVYVGRSGQTNSEGIQQLREILSPLGWKVITVPVTKVLHLKSAVTALPDGTVIGYLDDVDYPELFPHFLPMPDRGAAVLVLSSTEVLMSKSVPDSVAFIESLGYKVYTVDISELESLEGCVTCLSVRIRN